MGAPPFRPRVRGARGGLARPFNPLTRLMVARSVGADYRRLQPLFDGAAGYASRSRPNASAALLKKMSSICDRSSSASR